MRLLFLSMGYPSRINPSRLVFLQRLVNELADQGHECTVISPVKLPADKGRIIGREKQQTKSGRIVNVYFPAYLCFWLTARKKNDILKEISVENYINAVRKTIIKNHIQFDIVYSHFLGVSAECAVKIAEEYKTPVFAAAGESVFSYFDELDGDRVANYLNRLTGIISVSTENKYQLLEKGILTDNLIKVFPNGIDGDVFYPRDKCEARRQMGFEIDDFIIAFTGQFIERKGVLRVENACKDLPVKVAYAGKGPQMPLAKNTIWCQSVPPDKMPWFLSAADVFCLPTLSEGCCNAIIEALACGLPVISSNGAFNDDILDDSCSIRINPSSIKEIQMAVRTLASNELIRNKKAKASEEKGKQMSISNRANNIVQWMTEITDKITKE